MLTMFANPTVSISLDQTTVTETAHLDGRGLPFAFGKVRLAFSDVIVSFRRTNDDRLQALTITVPALCGADVAALAEVMVSPIEPDDVLDFAFAEVVFAMKPAVVEQTVQPNLARITSLGDLLALTDRQGDSVFFDLGNYTIGRIVAVEVATAVTSDVDDRE